MSKKKPIGLIKHSDGDIWSTADGRYKVTRTYGRVYTRGPFRAYYDLSFNGVPIRVGVYSLKDIRSEIEQHMGPDASPTLNRI